MEPGGEDSGPQLEAGWAGRDAAAPEMRGGTSAFSPGSSPCSRRPDQLSAGHRPAAALRAAITTVSPRRGPRREGLVTQSGEGGRGRSPFPRRAAELSPSGWWQSRTRRGAA